ncbi:MAG: hypothetical protein JWN52_2776 [Actinomycetia bacterium]|nr:hypothetical protein [Actinomycetes bacterium]
MVACRICRDSVMSIGKSAEASRMKAAASSAGRAWESLPGRCRLARAAAEAWASRCYKARSPTTASTNALSWVRNWSRVRLVRSSMRAARS